MRKGGGKGVSEVELMFSMKERIQLLAGKGTAKKGRVGPPYGKTQKDEGLSASVSRYDREKGIIGGALAQQTQAPKGKSAAIM